MENEQALQDTIQSYDAANAALIELLDELDDESIDFILEKQQNRLEQISQRMYHEDNTEEHSEIIGNTLEL